MHQSGAIDKKRLKRLLTGLIDIYSPSGKEQDIVLHLQKYLKQAGLQVELQTVDEDRSNLLVLPRSGEMDVVFVGHVDTVAAYDYDNYEAEARGDEIKGLGAADMKSGCAAMIEAFLCYGKNTGVDFPAALALVVGEEESGDGSMALLRDYGFSWAIVGEPTDLRPCLSHYSYMEIKLTAIGKRMHASLAQMQPNAIRNMLKLLFDLTGYLEETRPDLAYNLRDMNSASAGFTVSNLCECWMDLHLPPEISTSTIAAEIEELIERHRVNESSATFQTIHAGYSLPDRGLLPDIMRGVYSELELAWKPESFPSHSDANLFWASGVKPIILGPGSLERAHTSEEAVSFSQTATAATIYHQILLRLSEG